MFACNLSNCINNLKYLLNTTAEKEASLSSQLIESATLGALAFGAGGVQTVGLSGYSSFFSSHSKLFQEKERLAVDYQVAVLEKEGSIFCLRGQVKQVALSSSERQQKGLCKNLELAKKINAYVLEKIPYSENFPNRTEPCWLSDHALSETLQLIRSCDRMEERLKKAELYQVGNCKEMAYMGMTYPGIEKTSIEPFRIEHADHGFLVLGRKSKKMQPDAWGPDAVICDPWSNSYFPATKFKHHLFSYQGAGVDLQRPEEGGSRIIPIVGILNPSLHSFTLDYSN